MRKQIILPGVALVGGVAGFFLRRWGLATAFEPESGLPIPGMPATWALVGFTAVILLALALLVKGRPVNSLDSYDAAFSAKGNTLYMFFMTAAAGLALLAGIMTLLELPTVHAELEAQATRHGTTVSLLALAPLALLAALCAAAAGAFFLVGRNNYKGLGKGRFNTAVLVPAYAACVWLIVAYQAKSGDPVLLDYVWQLFAVIAAVLGTYFMAGYAFERGKFHRAVFFALAGIYFALVALADRQRPSGLLLCGAFLLYLFPSVVTLIFNAGRPMLRRMPVYGQTEGQRDASADDMNLEETDDE